MATKKQVRMKKRVMHAQPPGLNVLLYKYNRQVCDSYKLYVKDVKADQWFLVTIEATGKGLGATFAPMREEPPKAMVKLK